MINEWSKYYLEDRVMLYRVLKMDGGSIHQSEGHFNLCLLFDSMCSSMLLN